MKLFRKIKAKKYCVPFELRDFWPPYYISFKNDFQGGYKVLPDIYSSKLNDIVPILENEGCRHFYKLRAEGRIPGSDHIVSPREFDLEYHHTEQGGL